MEHYPNKSNSKKNHADHRWNDTGKINHNLRHSLSNGIFKLQ